MSQYRFGTNDVFHNRIKAYPKCRFDIYDSAIYYNNLRFPSASFNVVPLMKNDGKSTGEGGCGGYGQLSLYEINVDRYGNLDSINAHLFSEPAFPQDTIEASSRVHTGDGAELIYPFVYKDSDEHTFKTITTGSWNEAQYGEALFGSNVGGKGSGYKYPLSASIAREYFEYDSTGENRFTKINRDVHDFKHLLETEEGNIWPQLENGPQTVTIKKSHVASLEATLEEYVHLSPHYKYSWPDLAASPAPPVLGCHKDEQEMAIIYVPSIFYGSSIRKGSVNLGFYVSGTLLARCEDVNQNGELIQTKPKDIHGTGSVAGVVLYNEGIIMLTGSWDLSAIPTRIDYFNDPIYPTDGTTGAKHLEFYRIPANGDAATKEAPKWTYWGSGGNDTTGSMNRKRFSGDSTAVCSSSYSLEFEGTQYTSVLTMFAHAPKGRLNHSNNPTYLKSNAEAAGLTATVTSHASDQYGFDLPLVSSSILYSQGKEIEIKNTTSSSFGSGLNFTGSFKKQTYISKIGIYDDQKRLIAIAGLANPVRKTEDREFTFKLKLDI